MLRNKVKTQSIFPLKGVWRSSVKFRKVTILRQALHVLET